MTHVKADGFTTPEPMAAAAKAGADAVGIVLIPGLKRTVTPAKAQTLLATYRAAVNSDNQPQVVGLFGDQPAEEVNAIVERLGLDAVQLCSNEGMAYCAEMTVPVYKVIGVDPEIPISAQLPRIMVLAQRHTMAGHRVVLDAKPSDGDYGGTGRRFDWEMAGRLAQAFDLMLAGGLTPDNVAEAIATVRPWGVDCSSGIETDGHKDIAKVRAYIEAARDADRQHERRGLRRFLAPFRRSKASPRSPRRGA